MIGSLLLASCCSAPEPIYVTRPLYHDPRPVLPRITEVEGKTVPKAVWRKIVDRMDGLKVYAEKLELIIDSTHAGEE